jgi:hypothetical protein
MPVRFLFGVFSAAALAAGLWIGASLGSYFAGEAAEARPAVRTIAAPEGRPASLAPAPVPTRIAFPR